MKIVVIDLSYIMASCINSYSVFPTSEKVEHSEHWETLYRHVNKDSLSFSPEKLSEVFRIFAKRVKILNHPDVLFIEDYQDLISELADCTDLKLHAISHFPGTREYSSTGCPDSRNWVSFLDSKKQLHEYGWWRNKSSKPGRGFDEKNFLGFETYMSKQKPMHDPQLVCVVCDPKQIPPHIQPVFDVFYGFYRAWFGIK